MKTFEDISAYLDGIGKYTKTEKKELYKRYEKLPKKYLEMVDEYMKDFNFDEVIVHEITLTSLFTNMNCNYIQAICTLNDIENDPELALTYLQTLSEIEGDIDFVMDFLVDDEDI